MPYHSFNHIQIKLQFFFILWWITTNNCVAYRQRKHWFSDMFFYHNKHWWKSVCINTTEKPVINYMQTSFYRRYDFESSKYSYWLIFQYDIIILVYKFNQFCIRLGCYSCKLVTSFNCLYAIIGAQIKFRTNMMWEWDAYEWSQNGNCNLTRMEKKKKKKKNARADILKSIRSILKIFSFEGSRHQNLKVNTFLRSFFIQKFV